MFEEQQDWFDKAMAIHRQMNPCVRLYGPGPADKKCLSCRHLLRKTYAKTYLKCEFRENTNGPATDHKARWPACAKYEPQIQEKP